MKEAIRSPKCRILQELHVVKFQKPAFFKSYFIYAPNLSFSSSHHSPPGTPREVMNQGFSVYVSDLDLASVTVNIQPKRFSNHDPQSEEAIHEVSKISGFFI
jgi:hypothetical protein